MALDMETAGLLHQWDSAWVYLQSVCTPQSMLPVPVLSLSLLVDQAVYPDLSSQLQVPSVPC